MSPGQAWIDSLLEALEEEEQMADDKAHRERAPRAAPNSRSEDALDSILYHLERTDDAKAAAMKRAWARTPLAPPPSPDSPPPLPPVATDHRAAPLALRAGGDELRAPVSVRPAPWYRRWWAALRGLERRLDVRRRRRAVHAWYPDAAWEQCQKAAVLARDVDTASRGDRVYRNTRLSMHLRLMGPTALPVWKVPSQRITHAHRSALTPSGTPLPPAPIPMLGAPTRRR